MTAEKHPLEIVREALEGLREYQIDDEIDRIVLPALTTLTTYMYMSQTQSCAECERLGRENAKLREAIRPEGWWFECCLICDGTYMAELHNDRGCVDDDEGITVKAWYRQNEELAELHAIIQAIAYERGLK